MYYRHELDIKYPIKSDEHMITVKHLRDVNFDENYPFRDRTLWYKIKRGFYFLLINTIVFPVARIKHGLRIYGRKNLRKNKALLKNGAITISNHVMMWDFLCILRAIRPHLVFFPAWPKNFEGPNAGCIRISGGIPVPDKHIRAKLKFKEAMESVLEEGKWLHIFPEGSMWWYYPDIRPFKPTAFKLAVKFNKPIVPISISFRPPKGIYKIFGKKPQADLHIGEPLLPDLSLSKGEAALKLQLDASRIMQEMNGIKEGDPTFSLNQNIDEYKKTM